MLLRFRFTTIKTGPGPAPGSSRKSATATAPPQAPHIDVSVCTRGLVRRLVTRIYFPDEAANASDFALLRVDPSRRSTLIAKRSAHSPARFEWDIILQGSKETVFFDI